MGNRLNQYTMLGGLSLSALMASCSGPHSALNPAGPPASGIDRLWWLMFWVSALVFLLVIAFLWRAVVRRPEGEDKAPPPTATQRRLVYVISGSVGVTALILLVFLVASMVTDRTIASIESPSARTISITGNQWWWKVRYEDSVPSNIVITANEIHIPVGEPVRLKLTSSDVIHSFWVPNLHGKMDLVPGRENSLWIQAGRAGVFEGQCAEFCGLQHARMRFLVVAQAPEEFDAWLEGQRRSAREPVTPEEERGRKVFLSTTCVMCHTIRGTEAGGTVAPDLTHLASRQTIGAGILPNTRGHLAGWVLDPQKIKPGNHMPPNAVESEDLHALLEYLRSLE